MVGAVVDILLGPLLWLLGGGVGAFTIWRVATSNANTKADLEAAEKELEQTRQDAQTRRNVRDAIEGSKSDGAGWHDRLSQSAADTKRERDL